MEQKRTFPRCWTLDSNRRAYRKDESGKPFGSPLHRGYWKEVQIVGETSKSWILSNDKKIKKSGDPNFVFSEEEVEDRIFVGENRIAISNAVRDIYDAETLKAIAKLIGYAPEQV